MTLKAPPTNDEGNGEVKRYCSQSCHGRRVRELVVYLFQAAIVAQRKKKPYFDKAPYETRPIAMLLPKPRFIIADDIAHIALDIRKSKFNN
jgi:hypothetical protein